MVLMLMVIPHWIWFTNGEVALPAYIGFNEDDTAGYTNGSLVFGTRPNTLGDNVGKKE